MNNQPDNQSARTETTDNTINSKHAKQLKNTTLFVSRWSGPFVSVLSYSLILGIGITGVAIMIISAMVGLFIDAGSSSGFGFLTGGIFLALGCSMILWELTRALGLLYQIRQQANVA